MADLKDGESIEVKGSAKKPYVIKNVGGVYSCTCPAWRNQSLPIEQRTCKHIRKLRGDEAEQERVGASKPLKRETKAKKEGPPLLLAHRWENDVDLADWWMSEKLDGVRAYWDGSKFLSRQGNEFHAPDWFIRGLPQTPLDGELWIGRQSFQKTVSVVRRQDKSEHWKQVQFVMFDAPSMNTPFEERLSFIDECATEIDSEFVQALKHDRCKGLNHLQEELQRIEAVGGEGLMLREPGSQYEVGRSTSLLKVKTFHDADAVVVDHIAGKGRHKGRVGALLVRTEDGVEFSVGTGLSDKQREAPPEVGSTVTYRFQEFTDAGVPRFPSFVHVRKDGVQVKTPETPSSAKSTDLPSGKARYFEFTDAKSSKFWEITSNGNDVTVRYGRIGANGTAKKTSFDTTDAAAAHVEKLINQKTAKGYEESEP